MAERARKLMSAAEFLEWDDGTDTRYELIEGVPVAMAPGSNNHMRITYNVARLADDAMRDRRPCRAIPGGGLLLEQGPPGRVYIPDLLVTCEPPDRRHLSEAPLLVVEVLSPSTQSYDKTAKLPRYAALPSIEEIWLVGSRARSLTLWERVAGSWHAALPMIGRAAFLSRVLGIEVSLDAVYELTTLASADDGAEEAGG
jgi:Uma2 family endonuclease